MNGIKSLDDFSMQGKSTGKRWASSNYPDSVITESSPMTINLGFSPTIIFINFKRAEAWYRITWYKNAPAAFIDSYMYTSSSDASISTSGWSITGQGFSFFGLNSLLTNITWIAYE